MPRHRRRSVASLLLALATAPSGALAACALNGLAAPAAEVAYDPFEGQAPTMDILPRATASGDCRGARVRFALMRAPTSPAAGGVLVLSGPGATLRARLHAGGGGQAVAADAATAFQSAAPSLALTAQGPVGGAPGLSLEMEPGQAVAPGTYRAQLVLLARVTQGAAVATVQAPVDIAVTVQPSLRLAVGGGDLAIDVGELKPGALSASPVRFEAYANVDYVIALQSANGFTLRRTGQSGPGPAYDVMMTPGLAALPAGDAPGERLTTFASPHGDGRRAHAMSVRMRTFAPLPAGDYSDTLTVEIRPRV